jgi:DnaJ-class molecular chaperone
MNAWDENELWDEPRWRAKTRNCPRCEGTGSVLRCAECGGWIDEGVCSKCRQESDGFEVDCPDCDGTGVVRVW